MFENVLVGVDGRAGGRDAIALAGRLRAPNGKLALAHVHHASTLDEYAGSRDLLEAERETAEVDAELLSVTCISAGRGLHLQAEDHRADLLVVGSDSHGALGRVRLADHTRAALNGAPCAVAIASGGYAGRPQPIATIGVAYNESAESKAALTRARDLAAQIGGAQIRALEVIPIATCPYGQWVPPGAASIQEIANDLKRRLEDLPDVEGDAIYGIAGEELAAFSDQLDILVVGSRGYGPLKRLVLGSTSNYLQRHTRCSLLVLPRGSTSPDKDPLASSRHHAQAPVSAAA